MSATLQRVFLPLAVGLAVLNIYVFSRFTVDDAFITWRYGKNLIEHGVWNYNPTNFDLTQAYTNPIYALLSIVPAYLGMDVVLFFKCFSFLALFGLVACVWYLTGQSRLVLAMLLFFCVSPVGAIHLFSGLETFLYCGLLGLLFILLDERKPKWAIAVACVLFLTRPEAWLLALLLPVYFILLDEDREIKTAIVRALVLGGFLSIYFAVHWIHFGDFLPNTFYIKNGATIMATSAMMILVALLPVAMLASRRRLQVPFLALLFSAIVFVKYASSFLEMNYAHRFAFHIFMPLFIYGLYRLRGQSLLATDASTAAPRLDRRAALMWGYVFGIALYFGYLHPASELLRTANYYPRLLVSHAELGKELNRLAQNGEIETYSMADAGLASFHADIPALDSIGLGSKLVALNGMTREVVEAYEPDVIVYHSRDWGIIPVDSWYAALQDFAAENGYRETCDIHWTDFELLRIQSNLPPKTFATLCRVSKDANEKSEQAYFWPNMLHPPWRFWHV